MPIKLDLVEASRVALKSLRASKYHAISYTIT